MEKKHEESEKPVYLTLIKHNKHTKESYSYREAKELGIFGNGSYAFLDDGEPDSGLAGGRRCPECGYSLREFERNGRFGCPECLHAFEDVIQPLLSRMHKDTRHRGKVPHKAHTETSLKRELRSQETTLEKAVREERFEDAAELRDQIQELQNKLEDVQHSG